MLILLAPMYSWAPGWEPTVCTVRVALVPIPTIPATPDTNRSDGTNLSYRRLYEFPIAQWVWHNCDRETNRRREWHLGHWPIPCWESHWLRHGTRTGTCCGADWHWRGPMASGHRNNLSITNISIMIRKEERKRRIVWELRRIDRRSQHNTISMYSTGNPLYPRPRIRLDDESTMHAPTWVFGSLDRCDVKKAMAMK